MFILLEPLSPLSIIFIGSHSPPSGLSFRSFNENLDKGICLILKDRSGEPNRGGVNGSR
jgi:hypothetical protein